MAAKRRKARDERKDDEIRVRVSAKEKEAWTLAAKKDQRGGLSGWLRFLANREAGVTA